MAYLAGWNIPGYLDECPQRCDTFEDARQVIIDQLIELADLADDVGAETVAVTFDHCAQEVNLESSPFETPVLPDGYVYWVLEEEDS